MKACTLCMVVFIVTCLHSLGWAGDGRVVLVIAANTSIRDFAGPGLPNISKLLESGSAGLMNVHTGRGGADILPAPHLGMEAECVSLGAGAMGVGGIEVWQAANAGGEIDGVSASALYRLGTGADPGDSEVLQTRISRISRANESASYHAIPGALGSALKAAGVKTAVVGNSDIREEMHREAVAVAMDRLGRVDLGDVSSGDLIRPDSQAPYGLRTQTDYLLKAVDKALERSRFVVVDFGDTYRADVFSEMCTDDRAALLRHQAALRLDGFLGSLASRLDFDMDTLVVLSPSARIWSDLDQERLTPVIVKGRGFGGGLLASPSTRRPGVVTLSDVAPTILRILDVPVPPEMVGRPMTSVPGVGSAKVLTDLNMYAARQAQRLVSMRWAGIAQSVIVVIVSLLILLRAPERVRDAAGWVALVPVCIPICMLLLPLFYSGGLPGAVILLIAMISGLLAACIRVFGSPLRALAGLCAVVVAMLVADMLLGAPLTAASIAGYSLTEGARYYGIGNELMGTLLGAALVGTGLTFKRRRSDALVIVLFGAVFLTIGLPVLGANLGGALASAPAMAVALMMRRGWKLDLRVLALVGVLTIVVIGSLFAADAMRSGSAQSHMGRAVDQVVGGGALSILMVMQRKLALNFMLLSTSSWSRLLGLSMVFSLVLSVWPKRQGVMMLSRSEGAAAVGACVGVAGAFAFNDSGVVAAATCAVILWTLVALRTLSPFQAQKNRRADE